MLRDVSYALEILFKEVLRIDVEGTSRHKAQRVTASVPVRGLGVLVLNKRAPRLHRHEASEARAWFNWAGFHRH